jgi:hypothetical protein
MPYSVLRIARTVENEVEVIAIFAFEDDAQRFVSDTQINDLSNAYDYLIDRRAIVPVPIQLPLPLRVDPESSIYLFSDSPPPESIH